MSEAPEAGVETPAPEPVEIISPDAPEAAAAPEVADGGDPPAGEAPQPDATPEEPKKPKSPVAQLQGRVGHLTKTIHQKDEALASERARREALEAILAAQGKLPEGDDPLPARPLPSQISAPAPGTAEFDSLVLTKAQQLAAREAFTRDCNAIYDAGVGKHGEAFKEAVANLGALDLMSPALVQAALATGVAPEVINALGSDVDEAARISALPPASMGVELAKLAGKLSAPKETQQVSRAPAPITPVGGAVTPSADIYDPKLSDADYYRQRAAGGAKYIRAPQ